MEIEISLLTKTSKDKYTSILQSFREKLNKINRKYSELSTSRKTKEKEQTGSKVILMCKLNRP